MFSSSILICLTAISLNMHNYDAICENSALIYSLSRDYDIDSSLIVAVGRVESRWTTKSKSSGNACGIMQVLPKYTKNPKLSCKDLQIPVIGIKTGAKKLNYWIHKYGKGNKSTGLCGYNAGFRCKGPDKNKRGLNYAKSVLRWERKFNREMLKQKREYENKSIYSYLVTLVETIGDYK